MDNMTPVPGTNSPSVTNPNNAADLLHQISLMQSLTKHTDQPLKLSPQAVRGLSDLLHQVEKFCEEKTR